MRDVPTFGDISFESRHVLMAAVAALVLSLELERLERIVSRVIKFSEEFLSTVTLSELDW